jgi:peptidyl-tRNA hydrolase
VALVFAREVTPGLTGLVKKLEAAAETHADAKFRAVVVLLSDDEKADARLKEYAEKEGFKKVVFGVEGLTGPSDYNLAKEADVTVLLYQRKTVKKNFAFGKGKLAAKEAAEVAAAVKDILPEKK